jgi:endonuclease/exonuclease/phosphatase family metal-dependent hydrolase
VRGVGTTVRFTCLSAVLAVAASGPHTASRDPLVESPPPSASCVGTPGAYEWQWAATRRPELDRWCMGVGPPVVTAAETSDEPELATLIIVSWNVHVGGGRVDEFVQALRARSLLASGRAPGIVLLLQEVFRAGAAVPEDVPDSWPVPRAIRPHRPSLDVEALATSLGFALAYAPSMRNGRATSLAEREDRGSAVLSSEPLLDVKLVELPFGRQRRVAVVATVRPRGFRIEPLMVVTAHLDGWGSKGPQADALLARIAMLRAPGVPVVMGIDTNATFGRRDGVVRRIARVLPEEPCGGGRTGPWLARLDFLFSTLSPATARTCETLQETYGSDHRPVVLTLHG